MALHSSVRSALANYLGRLPFMNLAARRVLRGGVSVFMFHRILPLGEKGYDPELVMSQDAFRETLDWLSDRFTVLPLDGAVHKRGQPGAGKKPFCAITFDDGWLDNFLYAFPLLQARGLPATIFLPVRFIGTDRRFWQERVALCAQQLQPEEHRQAVIRKAARHFPWFPLSPDTLTSDGRLRRFLLTRPSQEAEEFALQLVESAGLSPAFSDRAFLNWDEVLKMQNSGINFGSHTLNHVLLPNMEPARALVEIRDSRRELQERLDSEVSGFSYPWGAASALAREAAQQAGYRYAVATTPGGLIQPTDDLWVLPRIALSDAAVKRDARFHSDQAFLSCGKSVLLAKARRRTAPQAANGHARIKIVFVIDQISEWEGGTERQLHALIQVLDRQYFDPEICFIFRVRGFSEQTLPCPARWICPDPGHIPSFIGRVFRLARVLRTMRPQIVQTFFIEGIVAGIVAGRLARVPLVVGSSRNAGYWMKMRHRIAFRTVAPFAHVWQCNSRAMWDYARKTEHIPSDRIELLPNALDLARYKPATAAERLAVRQALGVHEKGPVFVSVAALIPVKDLHTLLDAAKQIKPHLSTAQILIVGDGPLRRDLEQYAEALGLGSMVRFAGRQADIRPYLAAADFGVFTSKSEGSSNSVLEYMAMGLPSVVSDIAPNRELVNGLLFAAGDATDLARKMTELAQDPALRSRLQTEYLATAAQYSLEKFALRAQSYYNRMAKGR